MWKQTECSRVKYLLLTVTERILSVTQSDIMCVSTQEPVLEQKEKIATQHNLQNETRTQMKWFAKEDNETYSIPMIIN